jgi:hypothetical protein
MPTRRKTAASGVDLDTVELQADESVLVALSATSDGIVIADAIRLLAIL